MDVIFLASFEPVFVSLDGETKKLLPFTADIFVWLHQLLNYQQTITETAREMYSNLLLCHQQLIRRLSFSSPFTIFAHRETITVDALCSDWILQSRSVDTKLFVTWLTLHILSQQNKENTSTTWELLGLQTKRPYSMQPIPITGWI